MINRTDMYRQLYGIGNLVEREKYGLGSKLKKFVRNVIPNEIADIAVKAAPFVAPFNPLLAGAMAGVGTFDRTGSIGSGIKLGLINYGLGQAARYIGGAGFQEGFNPFAGANFSGGFTSGIQSLFTSPIGTQTGLQLGQYDFFKPYSNTPTQELLKTPTTGYTGGADALTFDPTTGQQLGRTAQELQSSLVSGGGISPSDAPARSAEELIKTYGTRPGTQPGYLDLIKKAGSLDPNVSISQRFDAVKDLSTKAIQDLYTKPIRNAAGEIVDRELDKNMLISTAVGAASYAEAIGLLEKAGVPEPEKALSEEEYQRLKVQPEKEKITSLLKPEAFGIRSLSAGGGLMNDPEGVLSIKLTPAMAMGGRIDYETGGPTTPPKTLPMDLESLSQRFFKTNLDNLTYTQKQFLYEFKDENKNKKAKGGIMGSEIPVRQNQGGVTELDLRKKGGFIPVGIKEKADDVPAMLSRNEFVFTADAVRGAGKGSINKGAQKMYKLMKSLEKKVKKTKKVA